VQGTALHRRPGMVVADVARRWQVSSQQVFTWRREMRRAAVAPLDFVQIVAEPFLRAQHGGFAGGSDAADRSETHRCGAARGARHRWRTADDGTAVDPGLLLL
jgi:hypothetical protein